MSKMLDRVSKILNQAENAGTPAEAAAFMEKAQELATINGIDLAIARLHQAKKEKAQEPEQRRVQINPNPRRFFRKHFIELAMAIADVNDIEYLIGGHDSTLNCFGFPEDIDVLEALFAHLAVQMVVEADEALKRGEHKETREVRKTRRIDIHFEDRDWGGWDGKDQYYDEFPFESEEEYEEEIARDRQNYNHTTGRWRKAYPPPKFREEMIPLDELEEGESPFDVKEVSRVDGRTFRGDFYDGFISRMRGRLWEIRKAVEKDHGIERETSSETAVALRDKREEVKKAYEEHTAHVKYIGEWKSSAETKRNSDYSGKARDAGTKSAERVPIDQGREVKR